ncbi:hypothetical protein V3C99_009310, partial [Haemonchus contortus]
RMFPSVETDFGLSMLRYAPADDSLVVSPISVIFALAMVQAGSKGTTKSQINSVISNGASDKEVEDYYSKLFHQIMNPANGVKSRIANGFFLNKQFKVEKDYEQTIKKAYKAKVEALDFEKAKEAAKVINDFIARTTEGKIRDMVNENSVAGAFSLIVNAIYFTAEWKSKFYKNANTNGTFYSSAGNERKITIPKMKIETDFKLKEALIGMGVTEMFSNNANLTGITKEPPLKVSNAAHRAIIEVDENGTTAAAATVLTVRATGALMREEPVKFQANHPFMFILTKDSNPLFMGQFV